MMVKNFIFLFKLRQKSKIIVNSVGVEARGGGGVGGGRKMPSCATGSVSSLLFDFLLLGGSCFADNAR